MKPSKVEVCVNDQAHSDHNQPSSDFSSFVEILLVFTAF